MLMSCVMTVYLSVSLSQQAGVLSNETAEVVIAQSNAARLHDCSFLKAKTLEKFHCVIHNGEAPSTGGLR